MTEVRACCPGQGISGYDASRPKGFGEAEDSRASRGLYGILLNISTGSIAGFGVLGLVRFLQVRVSSLTEP